MIRLNMKNIKFKKSTQVEISEVLAAHLNSLSQPMDSFLEDMLTASEIFSIENHDKVIGYAAKQGDYLGFFHIILKEFNSAPAIFEEFCKLNKIHQVQVITQDSLMLALISEWEYKKTKGACWFIDRERLEKPSGQVEGASFRKAVIADIKVIEEKTEGFFNSDNPEKTLTKNIENGSIFVLMDGDELLGCGVAERGVYTKDCVSIGMVTVREKRMKGVGQTILWYLKEWAYENGLRPVAGCWYYNSLSRKTLERAGMITASRGFNAELLEKENIPIRTGNPPGELVKKYNLEELET
jgi:hypothetical protein